MTSVIKTVFLTLILAFTSLGMAQEATQKHPRVLEVEKMLSKEGLEFLRARFPGRPFIVTVSVDPLHRPKKNDSAENLPYYDMTEEERFDEWDDASVPAIALMNRVKKINVVLTVPADLSEDELTEIKASLIPNLGMIEARDSIEVRKRSWLSAPAADSSKLSWYNVIIYGTMLLFFMLGLFAIVFTASSRLSRALKDAAPAKSGGGGDSTTTISLPSMPSGFGPSQGSGGGFGGTSDVKMLDSLKFREHVATGIKLLHDHVDFPRMEDMIIFEAFAQKNPGEFGAFIAEMPYDLRQRIFGLSQSLSWLEAMTQPTDVGNLTLEQMQKCLRIQRNEKEASWQNLLISVWRLQDLGEKFFQGIPQIEAMTIMAHLPKGDGVKWARTMFPGNWGQMLDPAFQPKPLNDILTEKYTQKALSILPLRKAEVLQKYQAEKEVLQYVRLAPLQAEKEVYLAAGADSNLKAVRPPFFPFFDLDAEKCKEILSKFTMEEWAMALFNTPKPDRRTFESVLNQKQRIRMYEVFRKLELKNPSATLVADIRERIGVQLAASLDAPLPAESSEAISSDSNASAA